MQGITIDRLTLEVPGLSDAAGRRLAGAVAGGLASASLQAGATLNVTTLRIDLTAGAAVGETALARQVVAEILRQVQRSP